MVHYTKTLRFVSKLLLRNCLPVIAPEVFEGSFGVQLSPKTRCLETKGLIFSCSLCKLEPIKPCFFSR